MSNDAVKRAEARRAAKEQAEANARKQATADSLRKAPAAGTPAAVAAKTKADQAAAERAEVPASRQARKQNAKKAQQEAVKAQADKDALLKPSAVVIPTYAPGETPPLHVLNAMASQADADVRDEATEIAKQVGRITKDLVIGRASHRGRGSRWQRKAEGDLKMARAAEQS